jgi:hypothetical protein
LALAQKYRALALLRKEREERDMRELQEAAKARDAIRKIEKARADKIADRKIQVAERCRKNTLYMKDGKLFVLPKQYSLEVRKHLLMSCPTAKIINAHLEDDRWAVYFGLITFEEWQSRRLAEELEREPQLA